MARAARWLGVLLGSLGLGLTARAEDVPERPGMSEILSSSPASAWEDIPAEDLLVVQVGDKRVLIELAPAFAPANVANIRTLASERYYDGLAIVRSQDNYVVQWADPEEDTDRVRPLGSAAQTVPAELDRPLDGLGRTPLASADAYADQVGFVGGLPVGSDGSRAWLAHCYGAVGVARGNPLDSGNGSSLYVVTGHAPRHLDRNITVVGRVIDGIDVLSALPRGTGALGFYTSEEATTPITSIRVASALPEGERPRWQRLRTDSETFQAVVASRTHRHEAWFAHSVGRIGLCNVPLPRRPAPRAPVGP